MYLLIQKFLWKSSARPRLIQCFESGGTAFTQAKYTRYRLESALVQISLAARAAFTSFGILGTLLIEAP